jgi:hypothetical protein
MTVSACVSQTKTDYARDRQVAKTKRIILSLAEKIDAIERENGTLPVDENELVRIIGQLPETPWGDVIQYRTVNGNKYRLQVVTEGMRGMVYLYLSDAKTREVITYPF